jgi:hypothetical protein
MCNTIKKIDHNMIAYCGMNCVLCIRNQTPWKKDLSRPSCLGCREQNKSCAFIKKKCKNIKKYKKGELNFCCECDIFPCDALSKLDEMYIKRYDFSMVANQKEIKEAGLGKFIKNQQQKYTCRVCGSLICIHEKKCLNCALKIL